MSSARGRALVAALAAAATLAVLVGGLARLRVDTGTAEFLPSGDPAVAATAAKDREFGGDPIVVLVRTPAPGGPVGDTDRLLAMLALEGRLARLPDVAVVHGPATMLNQVVGSARGLVAQIAGRRDGARAAAEEQARVAGAAPEAIAGAGADAVAAVDRRYAPLLVSALPAGVPTLHNPGFVRGVVLDPAGAPRPSWRFVVPGPDTAAVHVRPRADLDQAGTARLVDRIRAETAAAGPVTASPGRAERRGMAQSTTTVTGTPVITSGLAAGVTRELPLLAALVAAAVAIRFWWARGPGGPSRRGWRERAERLRPLLAAATGATATPAAFGWAGVPLSFGAAALLPVLLGVGSSFLLYLSRGARSVVDRRTVLVVAGAAAAGFSALALSPLPFVRQLGLALALGVVLTVLAALGLERLAPASAPAAEPVETPEAPRPWPRGARIGALLAAVVVAAAGWGALGALTVRADPFELARGLPELADARAAQDVLGSSGEATLVLRGPDALSPAALTWTREAQRRVVAEHGDRLRPVLTAPDLLGFLGPDPTAEQIRNAATLLPDYLRTAVLPGDGHAALLTFGVRLEGLDDQGALWRDVRATLPPPPTDHTAELAGLPVAAGAGVDALSDDRWLTGLAGVAAAGAVLAIGLRRRRDAARAVVAALLAAGWGFAALWLLDHDLTTLTVALAALAAVSAGEFTVLRGHAARSGSRWLARSVGLAALTSALGYAALAVSGLWVLRDFGLVLVGTVALAAGAAATVTALAPDGPAPAPPAPARTPDRVEVGV